MRTIHKIIYDDSNNMSGVPSESVNLVVTSPPYPMIEMWDGIFSEMNPKIIESLDCGNGSDACNLMHDELNKAWKEVDRVMTPGGIVCINIGDATRKIGGSFRLFSNHSKIIQFFEGMDYHSLPLIIWRKQTNKPNKFMGSGMLPTSAYVTLEHEYILIFRKGDKRSFNSTSLKTNRGNSAYFWEERNIWFSDIWMDLKGASQQLTNKELRERSGSYPFELPYRLINMYSVYGDTVLDPFLGTGTTTIASMCLGRNSIGYEIDQNFSKMIESRINEIENKANNIIKDRVKRHIKFINKREVQKEVKHFSENNNFKVMTRQEKNIFFPLIMQITKEDKNKYIVYLDNKCSIMDIITKETITNYE